jgi:hypothetical protein
VAKLGVGIGEDFPMDESARTDDQARRDREWARRKQAFRDFWAKVKIAARESFGDDWDHYSARLRAIGWWPYGILLVISAAFFLVAVITALATAAPALLLSAALFAFVFWRYRKRYGGPADTRPEVIVTPPTKPPVQE